MHNAKRAMVQRNILLAVPCSMPPTLCATDALQHPLSLLQLSTLNQTVGCIGKGQGTKEQHEAGHSGKCQAQTPTPGVDVLGTVVDELSHKDTGGKGGHIEVQAAIV